MKTIVLYEVESGTELPKEFNEKNIVNTFTKIDGDKCSLFIWCIEDLN